jgi:hypothetical protein
MLQANELQQNREMKERFLVNRPIDEMYKIKAPGELPYGYIYCIENKTNHKKYIGSTYSVWTGIQKPNPMVQLRKRASQYLYEYNHCMRNNDSSARRFNRPILKAMIDEGFDNFIMYPVAETERSNHKSLEAHFIKLLGTVEDGYNVYRTDERYKKPGTRMTAAGKKLRSEPIVSINLEPEKDHLLRFDETIRRLYGLYKRHDQEYRSLRIPIQGLVYLIHQ